MDATFLELIKRAYYKNYSEVCHAEHYDDVYDQSLSRMLCEIRKNKIENKTIVGVLFEPTAPDMAIRYIADGLSKSEDLYVILIVKPTIIKLYSKWFSKNESKINFYVCDPADFYKLEDLDIVFLPERWWPDERPFPEHVVKVGCQHGIDMQLSTTLDDYGGAIEYDYVLLGREGISISQEYYCNKYPNFLLNKLSKRVVVIPFGSPKLDSFINAIPECPQRRKRIIYHLSTLVFESNREIIPIILEELINKFKDCDVVFRCFPDEREHPFIKSCISKFKKHNNFIFSTEDSYIVPYSSACCMITTFSYDEHLFRLATGLPVIYFDKNKGDVKSIPELTKHVSDYVSKYEVPSRAERVKICLENGVYNPGASIEYLISNMSYIRNHYVRPDWLSFPLYSDTDKIIEVSDSIRYWESQTKSFNGMAVNLINTDPNSIHYRLLAAESFSRQSNRMDSLRHSILHLAHAIRCSRCGDFIDDDINRWWKNKGRSVFLSLLNMLIDQNQELTRDERFIWFHYYAELKALIPPSIVEALSLHYKIKEMKTNEILPYDELTSITYLYGSGEIAADLIISIEIENGASNLVLLDSDKKKHGMSFMGCTINSPDELYSANNESKVIICSHAFLDDILTTINNKYTNIKNVYYLDRM